MLPIEFNDAAGVARFESFVKFFSQNGLNKIKQLVNMSDIHEFEEANDETIIVHDDQLRKLYIMACASWSKYLILREINSIMV